MKYKGDKVMHRIYITGTNEDVLQKMQANGFNVTTCGDCGQIKLHTSPVKDDTLTCDYCGMSSDPCDFPDLTVIDNYRSKIMGYNVGMDVLAELASAVVERQYDRTHYANESHSYTAENGDIHYIEEVQDEFDDVLGILENILNEDEPTQ